MSKDRSLKITDALDDEMNELYSRPLLTLYAAILIGVIHIRARGGAGHLSTRRSASTWRDTAMCWASGPAATYAASPPSSG